jgi:hypothetical protein
MFSEVDKARRQRDKRSGKDNLKLKRQKIMLKAPGAVIECQRLRSSQSVREEWREQTTRGIERLCRLAEADDREALERLKAVEEFLRAALEYLQAAERFNGALGTDDSLLDIPDSRPVACASLLH